MIVNLPFPSAALFPNRKDGKSHKTTYIPKASDRDAGFYAAKQALHDAGLRVFKPKGKNIPVYMVFCPREGNEPDLDNCLAACKPMIDGVARALVVNDKRFRPILIDFGPPNKQGSTIMSLDVTIRVASDIP